MNTVFNTKRVFAGLVLASSAFFAANASAVVIGAWDWTSDGGFSNVAAGPTAATCNNGALQSDCSLGFSNAGVTPSGIDDTSSIITWGTPSTVSGNDNQSGLQAVFGSSGSGPYNAQNLGSLAVPIPEFQQLITNGGWTNTGAAVHYNNVITIPGGAMASTTLATTFQLTAPIVGPVVGTQLGIQFNETSNLNPACPGGNPHGTICDDIFSLTGALDPITFQVLGQTYKISFRFADGPGAIVQGNTIYTAELKPGTAVIFVQARIDTVPVPGVLALMGMGLVMIGLQVRGRRRKLV
jgi:hypothetical protein